MGPNLYLHSCQRKEFIDAIIFMKETYLNRINPVFKNLEKEAEGIQKAHYNESGKVFNPEYDDPGDYAEEAYFKGLDYFDSSKLMEYNTRLLWISMLYQSWEQQLRKFLYKQLTRFSPHTTKNGKEVLFKDFCSTGRITEFESKFNDLQYDLKDLKCWSGINELRLLNNVIKHSEGSAASQLRLLRPDFFASDYFNGDSLSRGLSTLNDITLNVSDADFIKYVDIIVDFWRSLPEHIPVKSNSNELFEF